MSSSLPIFQTKSQELNMLQTRWATEINPVLRNPSLQSMILKDVSLQAGSNTINTGLGRALQGWRIIRINGLAQIYDNQDNNPMPKLTLILVSDAVVTVSLEVF